MKIGNNGKVATVYNVGKIEESALPSAKILAVVGSKPLGKTLSNSDIPQADTNVKVQYSIPTTDLDAEYMSAVESGDTETAQREVEKINLLGLKLIYANYTK